MNDPTEVSIKLSRQKALVLFEWAYRFMERQDATLTHPADAVVVDTLASELEWLLPEVFTDRYPQLLVESRSAVLNEYRKKMFSGTEWLDGIPYQDIP